MRLITINHHLLAVERSGVPGSCTERRGCLVKGVVGSLSSHVCCPSWAKGDSWRKKLNQRCNRDFWRLKAKSFWTMAVLGLWNSAVSCGSPQWRIQDRPMAGRVAVTALKRDVTMTWTYLNQFQLWHVSSAYYRLQWSFTFTLLPKWWTQNHTTERWSNRSLVVSSWWSLINMHNGS